jgi:cysteine synthase A
MHQDSEIPTEGRPTDDLIETEVGGTPLVRLQRVVPDGCGEVWLKVEGGNPTGSYKDRMAVSVIGRALEQGDLRRGERVVEYTGGSAGTSLAFVAARCGLHMLAVSSDAYAPAKLRSMRAYGAEVIIEPSDGGSITSELTIRMRGRAYAAAEEPGRARAPGGSAGEGGRCADRAGRGGVDELGSCRHVVTARISGPGDGDLTGAGVATLGQAGAIGREPRAAATTAAGIGFVAAGVTPVAEDAGGAAGVTCATSATRSGGAALAGADSRIDDRDIGRALTITPLVPPPGPPSPLAPGWSSFPPPAPPPLNPPAPPWTGGPPSPLPPTPPTFTWSVSPGVTARVAVALPPSPPLAVSSSSIASPLRRPEPRR